jgi:hypothetical protein
VKQQADYRGFPVWEKKTKLAMPLGIFTSYTPKERPEMQESATFLFLKILPTKLYDSGSLLMQTLMTYQVSSLSFARSLIIYCPRHN